MEYRRGGVRPPMSKTRTKRLKQPDLTRYAPHEMRLQILERDSFQCRHCATPVTNQTANIDHIIPWKVGGPTMAANLVTACWQCNKKKGNGQQIEPLPLPFKEFIHTGTKCQKPDCRQSHFLRRRKPKAQRTHKRVNCQKTNCHMRHHDLNPGIKVDRYAQRLVPKASR